LKKTVVRLLKFALPVAIIAWLLTTIPRDQLQRLHERLFQDGSTFATAQNWLWLAAAFGICLLALCLTFVRWYLLVRTLQIPFRMRDAFRLGFLGFLFNFVSMGAVGGDLFRALFIAHEQPARRAEAVATVVVDRIIGLYALLLVTSAAILFSDISDPSPALATICRLTFVATGIGGIGVVMVLVPGFTRGSLSEFLTGLPKVGTTIGRLIASVRLYRDKYLTMAVIFAMSMLVHTLFAVAMYMIAKALFKQTPTLAEHLILVPLCMVAGALPFTPAGLGSFEIAMEALYQLVPAPGSGEVSGILVALVYRLITIGMAAIGVVYYWLSRSEVREVMQEAEHANDDTLLALDRT